MKGRLVKRTMKAVRITRTGGPDVLELVACPVPTPEAGELLIRVAAAGLNHADLLQRQGRSPPTVNRPDIPGLEVAGRVEALGPGATQFAPGDAVCALTNGGGYAEYCVVPAELALPLPQGLSFAAGAGLPEAMFTAWSNLVDYGRLKAGERVLVHGGASGVGTTAIQLARELGAEVYATAGTDEKCTACVALGAKLAVNYRTEDFVRSLLDATDGVGIDLILDVAGGDYLQRNAECASVGGRIINIAHLNGQLAQIDIGLMMRKRLSLMGSMLRPLSLERKARIARCVHDFAWPRIAAGSIRPVIHAELLLPDAASAHAMLERGGHVGKLILRVAETSTIGRDFAQPPTKT
jgi:putative PIG3 family NAD(P)H quinone oxidoreductase